MQAKLPATRKKRKTYSSPDSMIGLGCNPVRSAISSFMVGRRVNVKMTASITDHRTRSRKASHGTPGLKYRREVQSRKANGEFKAPLIAFQRSRANARMPLPIHPMNTNRNWAMPAQ
jgi:hypothetical protein